MTRTPIIIFTVRTTYLRLVEPGPSLADLLRSGVQRLSYALREINISLRHAYTRTFPLVFVTRPFATLARFGVRVPLVFTTPE